MNPLNHVAIIMDGNGRWGLKNKNSRNAGHKAGLKTVEKIIKHSIKSKIKYSKAFKRSTLRQVKEADIQHMAAINKNTLTIEVKKS